MPPKKNSKKKTEDKKKSVVSSCTRCHLAHLAGGECPVRETRKNKKLVLPAVCASAVVSSSDDDDLVSLKDAEVLSPKTQASQAFVMPTFADIIARKKRKNADEGLVEIETSSESASADRWVARKTKLYLNHTNRLSSIV